MQEEQEVPGTPGPVPCHMQEEQEGPWTPFPDPWYLQEEQVGPGPDNEEQGWSGGNPLHRLDYNLQS